MNTGHAQSMVMEGSCTPLSTASGILVDDKSDLHPNAIMECHVCMDSPTDPVATSCGHVFCWQCIYQWLQNGPKPCPVCRKNLSKHLNILPLQGAAAAAGPSNGNDSVGEAAAADNVILPRPPNPLLFFPQESSMEGSGYESDLSPESKAVSRAISELLRERARGRSMVMERANMKHRKNDLLQRISDKTQEAIRMRQQIARLQRQLAQANQQLPSGWSDDV